MKDPTLPIKELDGHDYRFVVRRNSPEPTGVLGTFYGEDLMMYSGFLEECILDRFGGGTFSLKEYRDGIPEPGVIRLSIAAPPKEPKKGKFRSFQEENSEMDNSRLKKNKKISEWLKSCTFWWPFIKGRLETEQCTLTKFDFISARRWLKQELEEMEPEEIKLINSNDVYEAFHTHTQELCSQKAQSNPSSDASNAQKETQLLQKPSEEIQGSASVSLAFTEMKSAIEKNQSQIKDINLNLRKQDFEIDQVRKSVSSIIRDMKREKIEQIREEAEQKRNASSLKYLAAIGAVGVYLYRSLPEFKQFIDRLIGREKKPETHTYELQRASSVKNL